MDILPTLAAGLAVLLPQLLATLALLTAGVLLYVLVTPYREVALVRDGNTAAGIMMAGILLALALPLAATLATKHDMIDILVWGAVAVALQLAAYGGASLAVGGLKTRIQAGNTAVATMAAGIQIAVGLVNAGAMAG